MQKYSLLQSVQGGPYSNSSRMIDIDIPSGLLVDMTQSFIQLETSIIPNPALFTKGVSNLGVINTALPNITIRNSDLIKNCSLTSATKGKLEDIRRTNILSRNLQEFTKSTSEKVSTLNSLSQISPFANKNEFSPFLEARKIGTVPSAYKHAYLRIPLSDIFQLGLVDEFDTSALQTCRMHLELDNLSYYGLKALKNIQDSQSLGPVGFAQALNSGYDIPMTATYDCIEMIPFFVGEFVDISFYVYTSNGTKAGQPTSASAVITKIVFNSQTGKIIITTDFSLVPQNDGDKFSDFVITEPQPQMASLGEFNVLTAQLGLCTIEGKSASVNQIDYLTFTTEEYNTGNQAFLNKIFEIEPECVNVFIMQYNPATPSNLLSVNNTIDSYRLSIDGYDVVDRDVYVNKATNNIYAVDALHYDLISKTFKNASFPLKSLECASLARYGLTPTTLLNNANEQILLMCCPTPMTANTKKFQLNISTKENGSVNNVILFKQVFRSIKL